MNTQVNCLPIARDRSAPTTLESTPPESAKMTRSSPTVSRIDATIESTRFSIDHVAESPQMSNRKFFSMSLPWPV